MAGVSRRHVVMVGLGGVAMVAAGTAAVLQASTPARDRTASASLVFGAAVDRARLVGSAYRREVPSDPVVADDSAVPDGLAPVGGRDALEWFTTSDRASLREAAQHAAVRDFAEARVRELDGWILPLSVLQLSGIASLGA